MMARPEKTGLSMFPDRTRQPVLTVHLGGGLGNQLFQYAFGRRMALANHAQLCMDATAYQNVAQPDPERGVRILGLQHFGIVGSIVSRKANAGQATPWFRRKLRKYWNKSIRLLENRKPYYLRREVYEAEEKHFVFDPLVYNRVITSDVDYHGFWQTEKYFLEIEPIVRQELTVKGRLGGPNAEMASMIRATPSVCIHIRHGDNANIVAAALGVLPHEYFQQAITELVRDLPEARFYVFSDDIAWARQKLCVDFPTTFVNHNGDARNYEDLRLMSLCRHHIVANSTFGWWGAWLGKKPGQIVYAPRRYYQNIDRRNPDLYPPHWRLI
ncbi:MAG TPA: alpha-1,2-fucosyltransferase [Anaerolineae bacterium]|nr:alpha-1,2-fucosyltransferase [Anaerolineae bacterium]